jgi:uncharacterized OsmC-like protein
MTQVNATTTTTFGRFLLSTRNQHLVADATTARGGPGEAWTAAELLLAALLTCAHAVLAANARESGTALSGTNIFADSEPDADRPGHYAHIRLHFELHGVTQAEADALVASFTAVCPIYGSLSRGAPVSVEVIAMPTVT